MNIVPSNTRIAELLQPYAGPLPVDVVDRISAYVELLLRWNARTNLTAVRDPELLLQRQVGESLFAATLIPTRGTLLDFGSGAGFPGIPLAILLPGLRVTLAESQGKKASFLREAVRSLALNAEVHAGRVESLPPNISYSAVIMRAVDSTPEMLLIATRRVGQEGTLIRYLAAKEGTALRGWTCERLLDVPLSQGRLASWVRTGS